MFPEKLVYLKTHPRPPPKEAAQLSVIIFNLNLHSTIWISKPLSSGSRDIFLYRNTPYQWLILKIESIGCWDNFPYFLIQHNLIVSKYQDWLIYYWQLMSVCSSVGKIYSSTECKRKCAFYQTSEILLSLSGCFPDQLLILKKSTFSTEYFYHTIPSPATARTALVEFMADSQLFSSRPQVRNLSKSSGHLVLGMWTLISQWLCVDLHQLI